MSKKDEDLLSEVHSDNITGYIMSEQMKSIDYNARNIKFIEKANQNTINQILGIIDSIIQ